MVAVRYCIITSSKSHIQFFFPGIAYATAINRHPESVLQDNLNLITFPLARSIDIPAELSLYNYQRFVTPYFGWNESDFEAEKNGLKTMTIFPFLEWSEEFGFYTAACLRYETIESLKKVVPNPSCGANDDFVVDDDLSAESPREARRVAPDSYTDFVFDKVTAKKHHPEVQLKTAIQNYNDEIASQAPSAICKAMRDIKNLCDIDVCYNPDKEAEPVADVIPAVDNGKAQSEVSPRRSGRPKASDTDIKKDRKIVEQYLKENSETRISRKDFARKMVMSVKDFNRIYKRVQARERREQSKKSN